MNPARFLRRSLRGRPLGVSVQPLLLLGLLLLVPGCRLGEQEESRVSSASSELEAVPWPALERAGEEVRQQVEALQTELEQLGQENPPAERERLADAYGRAGVTLLAYEFFGPAEVCFANAERLLPRDSRWPYLLGYLASMQGQTEVALESFDRALEHSPENRLTRLRVAAVRMERGEMERAEALYRELALEGPENAAVLAGLGRVLSARDQPEEAVALFGRALELAPEANWLHYALGQAHRRLGDSERAQFHLARRGDIQVPIDDPLLAPVATLGRSAGYYLAQAGQAMENERYDMAADFYRRALDHDSTDFVAWRGLAFSLHELGDRAGSMAVLEESLERARVDDPARQSRQQAEIHRLIAENHVLEKRDQEAIPWFERSLALDPERPDVALLLANALSRQKEWAAAIGHYDGLLVRQPKNAALLEKRATARVNQSINAASNGAPHDARRAQDLALRDFERALAAEPRDLDLRLAYAAALALFGREEEAQRERAAAAGAPPGDLGDALALAVRAARVEVESARFEDALLTLEEALSANADTTKDGENVESVMQALSLRASLLGHVGRYADAATAYARIVEVTPRAADAWRGEITARLLAADYHLARERLREALQVFPRDERFAHALARLLASAPDTNDRNGALAWELIQRLRSLGDSSARQETAAMALAELARWGDALGLQAAAVSAPGGVASRRLDAYRKRQAWVFESGEEIVVLLHAAPGQRAGS